MFNLLCIDCGFKWQSESAEVCECPMCEGEDIVIIRKDENE